jgi:hypothetical protein
VPNFVLEWREFGAPRSMKMDNIASPWRYDAAAETATLTRGNCPGYAPTFRANIPVEAIECAWHNMP